jgi:hypothetical protein
MRACFMQHSNHGLANNCERIPGQPEVDYRAVDFDYRRLISKTFLRARFRIATRELQAAQLGGTLRYAQALSRIWPSQFEP